MDLFLSKGQSVKASRFCSFSPLALTVLRPGVQIPGLLSLWDRTA